MRRRNLIPADAMPFTTAFDLVYDSGEFHQHMEQALEDPVGTVLSSDNWNQLPGTNCAVSAWPAISSAVRVALLSKRAWR